MQGRGEPVTWASFNSTQAGWSAVVISDANMNARPLKPHERFVIDSWSYSVFGSFSSGLADAYLSDNSTTALIRVILSNVAVGYYDNTSMAPTVGGASGHYTAPPQSEGISWAVGVTPVMGLSSVQGDFVVGFVTGTGYIVNAGGYTDRPQYLQKIS